MYFVELSSLLFSESALGDFVPSLPSLDAVTKRSAISDVFVTVILIELSIELSQSSIVFY